MAPTRTDEPVRDDTRTRLIDTTATLLQTQGYHGTGLNQILAEARAPPESESANNTPDDRQAGMLTACEREVAALIALGYTDRRIAAELSITEETAANHVAHILYKLGYEARSQISAWAVEQGLLADGQANDPPRAGYPPSTRRAS